MSASSRRRTEERTRRQSGQSLIEFAVVAPVLIALLVGGLNVATLISDKLIAGYATRQGARLAAQLGNGGGTLSWTQIDQNVVQAVLASSSGLNFAAVQEIDIYAPTNANGVFDPSQDQYDKFDGKGVSLYQGFPSTNRNPIPPNETSIGVRIVWQYSSPTGSLSVNAQLNEYTVMKVAPVVF